MSNRKNSSIADSQRSILSILRRGLQYEVFQDFQEVIYASFKRPSVVIIRQTRDHLRACFPRKRTPVPNEFHHYLLDIIDNSQNQNIVDDEELRIIRAGLAAEDRRELYQWGWKISSIGLTDVYIPIRLKLEPNSSDSTVAVLIMGKFRDPNANADEAYKWIHKITLGEHWSQFFPKKTLVERRAHETKLKKLFDDAPFISPENRRLIERELRATVMLLQLTLNRVLHTARLFSTEDFIHSLGLGQPGLHITERELWENVEGALSRISSHLDLSTAVIYSSSYSDYTDMRCKLSLGTDNKDMPDTLGLASYSEFEWLQSKEWTILPIRGEHFSWLSPTEYFGDDNAILFGREMIGGHLVILGFGVSRGVRLNQTQKAALYEAVTARVFRFIENALFRIELDQLLAETGHLMGRALGKVKSGADTLKELSPPDNLTSSESSLFRSAQWSLADGLMRLELIRQNFYSFGSHRFSENEINENSTSIDHGNREPVDAPKVLRAMASFFDRAAQEAKLKPIKYTWLCDSAFTRGREHDLKLVFLNIFDNALKFAYANTYIDISIFKEGTFCNVEFTNLGIGVASDESDRVFRRLARSRYKDPSKRIEGLGLGLSYCRRIITEIFAGTINLASREASAPKAPRFEGDNWLTTVCIKLPITAATD